MNTAQRNQRTRKALGISTIHFQYYRQGRSHWLVTMENGETHTLALPNLSTESSVLREMAEKLAKLGRPVSYPQGA
jgi:hypothetical protein